MRRPFGFSAALVLASFVHCGGSPAPSAVTPAPVASSVSSYSPADIDGAVRRHWSAAGLTPSPLADDATWLRRVHIDLVGTIPTPARIERFLADTSAKKREVVVDELLQSPEYAENWATYWDETLLGSKVRAQIVDRPGFHEFLRKEFAANRPWDVLARRLLAATGGNRGDGDGADPAVNWTLRYLEAPQDYAGSASRLFLGVQIQCAQCHDHKTESWKQKDFQSFASAALHFKNEQIDKKMAGGTRHVELHDAARVNPRVQKDPELAAVTKAAPVMLDGTALPNGMATRKAFADWMTNGKNTRFSEAFVNRTWGLLLGRGFVNPVDDIRPSNPAAAPDVLRALADDFAATGFDIRRLLRTIVLTEVYARSSSGTPRADGEDARLWSRFHMAPLDAKPLLNALILATGVDGALAGPNAAPADRAALVERTHALLARNFSALFDVDEDFDSEAFAGTAAQALTLLNGSLVNYGAARIPGTALDEALRKGSEAETLRQLFLRTLSREPTAAERTRLLAYVAAAEATPAEVSPAVAPPGPKGAKEKAPKLPKGKKAGPADPTAALALRVRVVTGKQAAWEDIFWSLLTSSEFFFNH